MLHQSLFPQKIQKLYKDERWWKIILNLSKWTNGYSWQAPFSQARWFKGNKAALVRIEILSIHLGLAYKKDRTWVVFGYIMCKISKN